jgi:hypothetical protein
MIYTPDKYVIVKVTGVEDKPFYKVFGTWVGGYLTGDSWRLNSGVEAVEEDGEDLLFIGSSGSVYRVHKDSVGTTAYTAGVLSSMTEEAKRQGYEAEAVELEELLNSLEREDE